MTGGSKSGKWDKTSAAKAVRLTDFAAFFYPAGPKLPIFFLGMNRASSLKHVLLDGNKREGALFFAGGDLSVPDAERRVSCGTH